MLRLVRLALLALLASDALAQMPPFQPFKPYAVIVDPLSGAVYALNISSRSSVEIFDGGTGGRRSVPVDGAQAPALDAAKGRLYVPTNSRLQSLAVIDVAAGTIAARLPLPPSYASRAFFDAGVRKVLVLQEQYVTSVDADTHAIATASMPFLSYEAALNPRNHRLYAAANDLHSVAAIDAETRAITTIAIPGEPSLGSLAAITVDPVANRVLLLADRGASLAVIDGATHAVTTIALPAIAHRSMAVDATSGKAYLTSPVTRALTVVDVATRGVTSVPLPVAPNRIALNEATGKLYIGSSTGGVLVTDHITFEQSMVQAGARPGEISVDALRNRVYVADEGALLVIEGALPPSFGMAVEYYRSDLDHYFVTTNLLEMLLLDGSAAWTRTGATFGTFLTATGTIPMCRFYLPPPRGDSHLMMANPDECSATAVKYPEFVYESADAFRVSLPDPVTGACAPGLLPAYRLWNGRVDSNHRYAVDGATRDAMAARGSIAEGYGPDAVGICVPMPATYTLP